MGVYQIEGFWMIELLPSESFSMTTLMLPPQAMPDIDPRYQVPDELWERLHPLIYPPPLKPKGG
jgi:hypothetical protein